MKFKNTTQCPKSMTLDSKASVRGDSPMCPSTHHSSWLNDDKLLARLKHCSNLPSPPGVAARIIELGQDPMAGVGDIADAVILDPALTAKILRMANSPMYARQRKTENLRQAIMMFGMNGIFNLALSFSLASTLRTKEQQSVDYNLFWRRSLAAATCCRLLSARHQSSQKEEFFLAALLQDIGILALDKAVPDLYRSLGIQQANHQHVARLETEVIGADHAQVGAWLLQTWHLPERLLYGVAGSHDPLANGGNDEVDPLVHCVAVSSVMADIWCCEDRDPAIQQAAELAEKLLKIDREPFLTLLDKAGMELLETSALFDVDLGDPMMIESILDRANEILVLRNIQTAQEASTLRTVVESLESKTSELEEGARRDSLTGLYNRAHLDKVLGEEFDLAKQHRWPLPVIFVDLDHFKQINDNHGHHIGDKVLKSTAKLLTDTTRDSDIVARYGGEEFVIVLVGTNLEGARVTCQRLINAFRTARDSIGQTGEIVTTASIGLAVQGEGVIFQKSEELLNAADHALYSAKKQGRDRYIVYEPELIVE